MQSLVKDVVEYSNHPMTFLWLGGLLQQFIHRCGAHHLDGKALKELRESAESLIQTMTLIGGQSLNLVQPPGFFLLPPAVTYIAPRDEDEDFLPPLTSWLRGLRSSSGGGGAADAPKDGGGGAVSRPSSIVARPAAQPAN